VPEIKDNKQTAWEEEGKETVQTIGSFIWELVRVFVIALLIIVPLRVFIAEPFIVSGSSMVPNYHNREYLIIDKVSYRQHEPQRGDVVVLRYPKDPTQYFIKRVIALPGETVKIDKGSVFIFNKETPNGTQLDEQYLPNQGITFGSAEPVTLGPDEFFVLGDNRLASSDSRVWGILPKDEIVGRVWLRVFPLQNFGFTPKVSYK
jgi:signal peptidase I